MRDRALPGTERKVTPVGLALRALMPARPGARPDPLAPSVLARACSMGIRLFDLSAGGSTAVAQRWVGALDRALEPELFVLSPIPGDAARAPAELLPRSLEEARHRLGGHPIDLLLLQRSMLDAPALRAALERARTERGIGDWGVALPPGPTGLAEARRALAQGARYFRLPVNLLDRAPGEEILELLADAGAAAFIADPHAQGLLDGSLLRPGGANALRPTDGPELARRFAPVRELAFLTATKERTLPQAAVQYALSLPAVAAVLIDTAEPEQLAPLIAATELPTIPPELRRRLPAPEADALGAPRPGGARPPDGKSAAGSA